MKTAIITRPKPAMPKCVAVYQQAGLKVFQAPCYDIQTNFTVRPEWLTANADVWVVLSVHALQHALAMVSDLKPPAYTRVIAVGAAVAHAWQQHYQKSIEYHPSMNSEGVIKLLEKHPPKSVKILTTADSRPLIKSHCMANQISYSQINTYLRTPLVIDHSRMQSLYIDNRKNTVVLTATSCGILTQFMTQLSHELKVMVLTQPVVVGAKRIAELAEVLGFLNVHLAASPSDQDMSEAVLKV